MTVCVTVFMAVFLRFVCCRRAFATLVNLHLPMVQSNAWHLSIPPLRPAFVSTLDALLTTQSRNPDVLCAAAGIVGVGAEVAGMIAALNVRARGVYLCVASPLSCCCFPRYWFVDDSLASCL